MLYDYINATITFQHFVKKLKIGQERSSHAGANPGTKNILKTINVLHTYERVCCVWEQVKWLLTQ